MTSPSPLYGYEQYPKFFKVFLPEHCSYHLHICSDFKPHLQSFNKKAIVTIHRPGINQGWKVVLEKENGEYYFTEGWQNFIQDNAMKVGEFMVFSYHGNSHFSVKLYGTHTCLKETVKEGQRPADVTLMSTAPSSSRRPGAGRPPSYDPDDQVVRDADKYRSHRPNVPSFMVVMTNSYLSHNLMNMPLKWVNEHMPGDDERYIRLKMQGLTTVWKVKLTIFRPSKGANCKLSRGLSVFYSDNKVQVGDICVFELLKNVPDTLKVTIFLRY